MGKINLFITNASNTLTEHLEEISSAVKRAEHFTFNNFKITWDIDVVVTDQIYDSTIPEDGVCGRTFSDSFIMFYVDPDVMTATKIYEMLCHELPHAARWGKNPEYSKTLFDNLILEGLAMVAEEASLSDSERANQTFCLTTIQERSKNEYDELYKKLQSDFGKPHSEYDFHEVFISGNSELPRWAGYSLGYHLVKQFIERSGKTIFEINNLPYSEFRKIL